MYIQAQKEDFSLCTHLDLLPILPCPTSKISGFNIKHNSIKMALISSPIYQKVHLHSRGICLRRERE